MQWANIRIDEKSDFAWIYFIWRRQPQHDSDCIFGTKEWLVGGICSMVQLVSFVQIKKRKEKKRLVFFGNIESWSTQITKHSKILTNQDARILKWKLHERSVDACKGRGILLRPKLLRWSLKPVIMINFPKSKWFWCLNVNKLTIFVIRYIKC